MMIEVLIEKLARIPQFYMTNLNHAKDKIAFYWDITGRIELYLMEIETKKYTQISHGEVPRALRSGFVWTRDDKSIIFAKDKDGNEQHDLYRLDIESAKVTQLTNTPNFQEHAVDTSPNGKSLLYTSTKKGQVNLYYYDFETKKNKALTNMPTPVRGGKYDPTGSFIVFGYNDTQDFRNLDIWIMDSDGSKQKKLLSLKDGSREAVSDISRDGKILAITSDFGGTSRAGIYDLESKELKMFGEDVYEEYSGKFTSDGKYLVCLQNFKATIKPIIYNCKTGEKRVLEFPSGIAAGTQVTSGDRYLILSLNTSTNPSSLLKYDLIDDNYEDLIPVQLGDIDTNFFVEDKYIEYKSTDGLSIGAILYKPKNIKPGVKLPALVEVHGGPTKQYFRNFAMFSQIVVNEGFVIIKPNFRGSTGYGRAFTDMNIMDIGGGDLEDVAAGAEYLKTLDYVDPTRIGIFGGSYGGYMTFIGTVKKPDLWKAGATSLGITNWLKLYEESMPHFKYYLHMLLGKPEENEELWKDRSSYYFAENLKCPLLIFHGINDPRCPISQARIFKDKLLKLGWKEGKEGEKTFEYQEFSDMGHGGFTDQEFRIRSFKTILDFFKRRL